MMKVGFADFHLEYSAKAEYSTHNSKEFRHSRNSPQSDTGFRESGILHTTKQFSLARNARNAQIGVYRVFFA
jgi:hypothetical protein